MADVNEKIEKLKARALKIRSRRKSVKWEGSTYWVCEPSFRTTEQVQGMEPMEVPMYLVRHCTIEPETGVKLFDGVEDDTMAEMPMGLVRELAGAVVSFIDEEAAKAVSGNSESTPAGN